MPSWLSLIIRLLEGILNVVNIKKKKDAVSNPASTIAGDGELRYSEKTFADISAESKRDKPS